MNKDDQWAEQVKGMLKAELKRRNVGYRELAEKLGALGIAETEQHYQQDQQGRIFGCVYGAMPGSGGVPDFEAG